MEFKLKKIPCFHGSHPLIKICLMNQQETGRILKKLEICMVMKLKVSHTLQGHRP